MSFPVAGAGVEAVAVVIGPERGDVRAEALRLVPDAGVFIQADRRGTAHAVLAARMERDANAMAAVRANFTIRCSGM